VRLKKSKDKSTRKTKIQIYVSPVDYDLLVEDGEKCGITVSELVRSLIRKHYDEKLGRV
jgi:hypothetical protein